MKLISNLNPNSVPGCYNGTLFLTISSQTDWMDQSPWWKAGTAYSSGLVETYSLTPGTEVSINLAVGDDTATKANLRVVGQMSVKYKGRVVANTGGPWGQGGDVFIPSETPPKVAQMFGTWEKAGAWLGFWLPVPWDGQAAVCRGLWWANWPLSTALATH
jgi:hypothetical protein